MPIEVKGKVTHFSEIGTTNDDLTPGGGTKNALGKGGRERVFQKPVHVEGKCAFFGAY